MFRKRAHPNDAKYDEYRKKQQKQGGKYEDMPTPSRPEYLRLLVEEFQKTEDENSKLQVLANLANFAYDPINYENLRKLNVMELFMDMLTEENEKFIEFGLAGLCNLCLEKNCKEFIVKNGGIKLIADCLTNYPTNMEIVASCLTALNFLMTSANREALTTPEIRKRVEMFQNAIDKRVSNLANIYIQDYFFGGYPFPTSSSTTSITTAVLSEEPISKT